MDRRHFFEQVAAWSAGACLATPVFNVSDILAAEEQAGEKPKEKPLLSVAKGKDYGALVERVMKPLGGIAALVRKGDRVVVKPNIGWDRTPEQAANTHPDVVKAIVQQCLDAGAKQVLVFDRTCNDERRSYARSGIQAAVESIGDQRAQCVFQDKTKYVPVKIENAKSIHEFSFYQDALESACDCYINVPVAKHHGLAKLTLGLKNVMGVIGGNRGDIHKDIGQRLADFESDYPAQTDDHRRHAHFAAERSDRRKLEGREGARHADRLDRSGGRRRLRHHALRNEARADRLDGGGRQVRPGRDRPGEGQNRDGMTNGTVRLYSCSAK